ncbi:MAG TPA: hypothetical protein VIR77_01170, partial [Pontiella sp.]
TLSGTPSAVDVGVNAWTVQVSDNNGGSDTATLNITVDAATAGLLSGYSVGSGLLSSNGETLFVDNAALGGTDITASSGWSDTFAVLIDGAGSWNVGDTVEITGFALPVHASSAAGDVTFDIRQAAGGAGASGAGGLASLGTVTASYAESTTEIMYLNFDTPISFVVDANSTSIGVHISSSAFFRTKSQTSGGSDRYNIVTGDLLTDDIMVSLAGTVTPGATPTSHVSSIVPSVAQAGGPNRYGVATVTILDAYNVPVSGATVSGTFTGSFSESGSAVTDGSGVAVIQTLAKTKNPSFTFTVDSVTASGYTYDPASNVETSDSY